MATDLATGIRRIFPGRLVLLAARAVVSFVRSCRDRRDERRACRLRNTLGRRRWLVSWHREDSGWQARLSCPARESTLERTGPTRAQAVDRASRALARILDFRKRRGEPDDRDAFSPGTDALGFD